MVKKPKKFKGMQYLMAYFFIAPALVFIGFVYFYPFIQLFRSSFYHIDIGGNSKWVGLNNFKYLYIDEQFWIALKNNVILLIVVPIMTIISIIIAVMLYEKIKGWKFYRVIVFLPFITSITALGVVFTHVLKKDGMINSLLESINLDFLALDWIGDPKVALYTVALIIIWKQVGFGIVLFLARLMSANEDLFDAAKIDGVNWFQNIRYMVIPQLSTIIQFYVVITGIYVISWIFDYIFIITYGGPGSSTYVLSYYVYQNTFRFRLPGIGNAASLILLLIGGIFITIQFYLRRRAREVAE